MEKAKCKCGCSECTRKTARSAEEQKKLLNRLSRIEGQIRGIRKMIEDDAYCTDVLMQSAAANAAINSFNKELIGNHLRTCVKNGIKSGNDEVIDDFLETLQKLMK